MSDAADTEYFNEIRQLWIDSWIGYAVTVLLPIYEFVITIDQEVATVWLRGNKFSMASILLVSTRWCMFILAMLNLFPATPESCKPEIIVTRILIFAGFAQVALFSALRVSAIWGNSYIIFFVILTLGLVPIGTNSFTLSRYVYYTGNGACEIFTNSLSDHTNHFTPLITPTVTISTRIPVIVADALVLILTWIKTFRQVVEARKSGITISVSMCLIRDGTLYFLILFALNLLELMTNHSSSGAIIGNFMLVVPPILVSRFMFNLRQIGSPDATQVARGLSSMSFPQFRVAESVFGNMAEPLEYASDARTGDYGEAENTVVETGEEFRESVVPSREG